MAKCDHDWTSTHMLDEDSDEITPRQRELIEYFVEAYEPRDLVIRMFQFASPIDFQGLEEECDESLFGEPEITPDEDEVRDYEDQIRRDFLEANPYYGPDHVDWGKYLSLPRRLY